MKNPFLEDRNIFSKVPKPISKLPNDHHASQNSTDQMPSYDSKYGVKPQIKPINTLASNPKPTSQTPNTYQRQTPAYTTSQTNKATNKYMSSQKITFGDPMSSEAYHGDRTSGYFNMLNSQQQNAAKPHQNKYDNLKYEPRKNNFIEHDNNNKQTGQQSFQPSDMKQTIKQFGKSYNQYNNNFNNFNNSGNNDAPKLEYEFAPPPINSFTTTQPFDAKYHYQDHNYDYKSAYGTNQQRPPYQTNEQQQHFQNDNQRLSNDSNLHTKKNPFTSNSYKSPPKQYDPPITPKGDISQRFKDNNYAQFSPIGEVSRHKINEDSIMNLDGLMDGIQLDKLLAESKTQVELLKILGMDASMIKKNNDSDNYATGNDYRHNQYQNRSAQMNVYTASYTTSQPQTLFNKKPYQPQGYNQPNRFQTFKDEDEEPQVFNYGQSSVKNLAQSTRTINSQAQNHRESPPKFVKLPTNPYQEPERNAYHYSQIQEPKTNRNQKATHNQQSQQEEYDMQKIMQRQMEKFTISLDGFGRDKRVFMTANQKIFAKKYKLQSL